MASAAPMIPGFPANPGFGDEVTHRNELTSKSTLTHTPLRSIWLATLSLLPSEPMTWHQRESLKGLVEYWSDDFGYDSAFLNGEVWYLCS